MKHFFQQTTEEVLSNLGTTTDGLNDAKVEEQRAAYGRNELEEKNAELHFAEGILICMETRDLT